MKREIEFRGQRTDNKEWVYGYYGRSKIASPSAMFLGEGDVFIEKSFIFNELLAEEVIPETVGQYVGITDKNGKKVYEGDILKIDRELELWENKTKHETFFGVVEYDEENTRFFTNGKTYKNMSIFIRYNISYEVIGNIFYKESDNGD